MKVDELLPSLSSSRWLDSFYDQNRKFSQRYLLNKIFHRVYYRAKDARRNTSRSIRWFTTSSGREDVDPTRLQTNDSRSGAIGSNTAVNRSFSRRIGLLMQVQLHCLSLLQYYHDVKLYQSTRIFHDTKETCRVRWSWKSKHWKSKTRIIAWTPHFEKVLLMLISESCWTNSFTEFLL